jgi:hypothetical protein
MGLKTDNSHVDVRLSKIKAAIKNIGSLMAVGNLAVNLLMERKAAVVVTTKAAFVEKPKWTTVMAKNMRQMINRALETLADAPK